MQENISLGDGTQWDGNADVVFTAPYGPIPPRLLGKPMILSFIGGKRTLKEWCGVDVLHRVGERGEVCCNGLYVANIAPRPIKSGFAEANVDGCRSFMPLELPLHILNVYSDLIKPGMTIWDGFMGRGTIGKAALMLGMNYIGIDISPERVALARSYLGS